MRCCLHGCTQNQNEAFNALIWQRAAKLTHLILTSIELATFRAVCHFNDGSKTLMDILEHLGIVPGSYCRTSCEKLDYDRVLHSKRKSSEATKRKKSHLRHQKKGYVEVPEEQEGPENDPGAF